MDKFKIINDLAEEFCLVGEIENILAQYLYSKHDEDAIQAIFKIIEQERLKARIDQTEKFYKEIRKIDDRSAGVLFVGKILLQQKLKRLK